MKLKTILFKHALCLLVTISFFSCSDDNDSDDVSSCNDSVIPFLKKGNTWTYNIKSLGIDNGQLTLTVKNCTGDGFAVDMLATDSTFDEILTNDAFWKETDDFILADVADNVGAKMFRKNAQLGDTWSYTQGDRGITTHEVIKIDSVVTVPAGTFTCKVYKYTATDIFNESFVFWNDEIGQIKEDAGFVSTELASYTVN